MQRNCFRGRDDTYSYEGVEIVTILATLRIKMPLFSSYLYGLVTRTHELCPPLGLSWGSQRVPPPCKCLTNPLQGTLCPPQGVVRLLGVLWAVPAAIFTPVPLPSSARLLGYLFIFKGRPWLPSLSFEVLVSFTRSDFSWSSMWVERGAVICALVFTGETKFFALFPTSAGTCHCLFTRSDHFQPNPCHFLQLQCDHLQPQ